ncbi:endonuclease/exonuclease/phosphatase family protein [Photobacterium sp. SDRW27]|uniref:endonuclease/exonuclease/phosphatase family protein n=1 Tax=Photobacterium obscurum TaxID=2829490 RepID=UPI002243E35A|nr:endonuclease/exonuclease/phosphatase family protein [Photobacterium obscurum]MCW8328680.1 endonuclease/exonuclease/phosphatase family protein [Photobacterium obscurum]
MKFARSVIAASIALAALTGCNSDNSTTETYTEARFATYNLSFDRDTYEDLVFEMSMTRDDQTALINRYKNNDESLTEAKKATAQKIIQIRNVAETIQRTRPNVFLLAEFNNKGTGKDMRALDGFHNNYLAYAQNSQVEPISFEYRKNIATNTGKASGFDLNNDGEKTDIKDDAWGFGNYHGQYAFAVFSQFEIDESNVRTFQNFKWKDMPGYEESIRIVQCDDPSKFPEGMTCKSKWYEDEAWEQFPLSSKNHADIPVIIPTPTGEETIHFLVSHPTPPIWENIAEHNIKRNHAEIEFWNDYVESKNYMYDDNNVYGGLPADSKFVVAGDLNADPIQGDGDLTAINDLLKNPLVNISATIGYQTPTSKGGQECFDLGICTGDNKDTPYIEHITSKSGLRLDHVIPSQNLTVTDSGVFWPASDEDGYHLVYDEELGISKGVSSDHRMVWMNFDLTK